MAENVIVLDGFLVLCPQCKIGEKVCEEYHHDYYGMGDERWICFTCGHILKPQEKVETKVEEKLYWND